MPTTMLTTTGDATTEELLSDMGRLRISQRQLARGLGLPVDYLNRRFTGENAWDVELLGRVCDAIGTPLGDLFARVAERRVTADPIASTLTDRRRRDRHSEPPKGIEPLTYALRVRRLCGRSHTLRQAA